MNSGQDLDVPAIARNLNEQVEAWNGRGSGFNIEQISNCIVVTATYRPLHAATYIPTPEFLAKKHCLINVRNNDEKCFIWAVLSALYQPPHNKDRIQNYLKYQSTLNVDGLTFPMQTKQINIFERNNPTISVNVLYFDRESKGFTVEYLSPERGRQHHVNLLLLDDADNLSKRHYVLINNMSRLVGHRSKTMEQHTCVIPASILFGLEKHWKDTRRTASSTQHNKSSIPTRKTKKTVN